MAQPPAFVPIKPPGLARLRPRSMLFTLFGDYVYPRGGEVWLGSLVLAGRALGMSEVAVRSAVARLAREHWIVARKRGRRSFYRLSPAGRALIEEGTRRIYHHDGKRWDGSWSLLTYSIPETKRAVRDRIRKRLAWMGFGALRSGIYIAPRDHGGEVRALAAGFGAAGFARTFLARSVGATSDAQIVRECWDVRAIARAYARFLRVYAPRFARDKVRRRKRLLRDSDAFVTRFMLTHDFRRFPFIDPDLPAALLPRRWVGARAQRLFQAYHDMLADGALRFFDACMRASSSGYS